MTRLQSHYIETTQNDPWSAAPYVFDQDLIDQVMRKTSVGAGDVVRVLWALGLYEGGSKRLVTAVRKKPAPPPF